MTVYQVPIPSAVKHIMDAILELSKTEFPHGGIDMIAVLKEKFPDAKTSDLDYAFMVFEAIAVSQRILAGHSIADARAEFPDVSEVVIDLAVKMAKLSKARNAQIKS